MKNTDMTDSMKAVVLARFGGPDAFELRDVPVPQVGPRQVRVRVHATAINPLDYQIRRGDYAALVPLPAIIGHDVSGVIEKLPVEVSAEVTKALLTTVPALFHGGVNDGLLTALALAAAKWRSTRTGPGALGNGHRADPSGDALLVPVAGLIGCA